MDIPSVLMSGEMARLFPAISESNKEQRASSIFLAVLAAVPSFARSILVPLGARIGTKTTISTYTEVVFKGKGTENGRDRPDGLIHLKTGNKDWSCILEAKIGNAVLEKDQIEKYLRIARDNKVDLNLNIQSASKFLGPKTFIDTIEKIRQYFIRKLDKI